MARWNEKDYLHNLGEEVNNSKVIAYTYQTKGYYKSGKPKLEKAYYLYCLTYEAIYISSEYSLAKVKNSPFVTGKRVCFKNSINYTRPDLSVFFKNIDDGYKLTKSSDKKIQCKCPACGRERYFKANELSKRGFNCSFCSKRTSYPERMVMSYLELKNILYEYQYIIEGGKYRFDFYLPEKDIYLEVNGRQHYYDVGGFMNVKTTQASDNFKKDFVEKRGGQLIFLDCRNSSFDFIKKAINNSNLPSIKFDEETTLLKKINNHLINEYEEFNQIIDEYKAGISSLKLAKKHNKHYSTIIDILKKGNIKINKGYMEKSVICLNNNKIFESISSAEKWADGGSHIHSCINGKRLHAGRHPETGERLQWKYLDEYDENNDKYVEIKNEDKNYKTKQIICLNNQKVFKSITQAKKWAKNASQISNCLKGDQKTAGTHPTTGEHLQWKYLDEYNKEDHFFEIKNNNGRNTQVICLNNGHVFNSIKEAKEWSGSNTIARNANGKSRYAGRHPETGEPLIWKFYNEYDENRDKYKKVTNIKENKKVICLNNNKIFETIRSASSWAVGGSKICECAKGKRNFAGKDPQTGEKLRWMYYEDYIN